MKQYWLLGVVLFLVASCSDSKSTAVVEVDPGPFCVLGTLPFDVGDVAWRDAQNENQSSLLPRIKHQPADILANDDGKFAYTDVPGTTPLSSGNLVVRGIVARTKDTQGLTSAPISGELVSVWGQDEGVWNERGDQLSDASDASEPGGYQIDLGISAIDGEVDEEYVVLNADRSCGVHTIFQLPRGRQIVVTDIDATMTVSDDEIFKQIEDENYDPVEMGSSVALTQAWASKGYVVVYLTARPHIFRTETRAWLTLHGYANGPVITATELVLGDTARQFKSEWLSQLENQLGWDIVAAYGNADSDIDAYADAGIDPNVTFIVGELAGTKNTVAIENNDYAAHIASYVESQPDAN